MGVGTAVGTEDRYPLSALFSRSLNELVSFALAFGVLYGSTAFLSLLFHLPTAGAFEQRSGDSSDGVSFQTERSGGSAFPVVLRIPVQDRERPIGQLTLTWCDGRSEVDRDEELALELLSDSIAKAALRTFVPEDDQPRKVVSLRK